jgi:hypothetical protein
MKARAQIVRWSAIAGLLVAISVPLSLAQNRRNNSVPQPSHQQSRPSYSQPRSQSRPQYQGPPRPSQPNPDYRSTPPRQPQSTYRPPAQGHHFGQWLNQQRTQPPDQQRRALQSDPQFKRLPMQRQQQFEQRLQHFNSLPPDRQQQVLHRGEVWEHLRPEQRQDFRSFASQYNSLPPERRQAVRNAIQTLRAMPPDARQREIQSGRFSQFSPQERQMLNNAANLPLAPGPNEQGNGTPSAPPQTGPGRYVPRPPQ